MNKVYVIGGANIDIQGTSFSRLVDKDSNPGLISYSFGGVGRNIAENLALLKENVRFVSAFGNDLYGIDMYRYCESVGVNMSFSIKANQNTSTYLAVMDENSDMAIAINDMRILTHIDEELISKVFNEVDSNDILILDTNLDEKMINHILLNCPCSVYMDPISTVKATKIKPLLKHIYMLKPNKLEAQQLSGIMLDSELNYVRTLDYFLDAGIEEIVISLGKNGVIAGNKKEKFWIKHSFVQMQNATGAGDSFLAGYVHKAMQGKDMDTKVRFAIASAILNVQSKFTVSELMSVNEVQKVLNEIEMERTELC